MCGFSGIIKWKEEIQEADQQALQSSIFKISHRGPDYTGFYYDQNAAFAHARLSILDLDARSHQPFRIDSLPFILLFNGEIYNYLELREELADLGYTFITSSDTEVVYYALIEWKQAACSRFNGMYTIGWYLLDSKEFWLVRDGVGIKPMNFSYQKEEGRLIFCSELNGILPFMQDLELEDVALEAYFQFSYIPAPFTVFNSVRKLLPGQILQLNEQGEISLDKFVSRAPKQFHPEERLPLLLEQAVDKQLIADVPVGTFLSGGIDSSILTFLASRAHKEITAYSIGFPDVPYLDESKIAAQTAKEFGIQHKILNLTDSEFLNTAKDAIRALPEPFADSSSIPFYAISKFARQESTVVLSGDGADELFAGYEKHKMMLIHAHLQPYLSVLKPIQRLLNFFPHSRENIIGNSIRKLNKIIESSGLKFTDLLWYLSSWNQVTQEGIMDSSYQSRLEEIKAHYPIQFTETHVRTGLLFDQKLVLPNDMLFKSDAMSMAHGLEVRVPFLDNQIVDFAAQLQAKDLNSYKQNKIALRDSFQEKLPSHIFSQRKRGFEVPLSRWVSSDLLPEIQQYIAQPHPLLKGKLNLSYFQNQVEASKQQKKMNSYALYYFYVLNNWLYNNIS